jgi:rhodanese-related sulfurtransferase
MKPNRFMSIRLSLLFCTILNLGLMTATNADEEVAKAEVPKGKQTSLGLYLTAAQAYDMWLAAPDAVKVIDVRTLEEYLFVGHAPMAWNVPLGFQTDEWDAEKNSFVMKPNLEFLPQIAGVVSPSDTILVMCRSGGRSAKAANVLAQSGYTNVYSIIDGMEGDAIEDTESPDLGKRLINGWKNSDLPWTYDIDPERLPVTGHPTQ